MSKNLGDLSQRVKRRLFEDDQKAEQSEKSEFYDVVDKDQVVAEFLELCDTVDDQTEEQGEADITPTESAIKRNLSADEKPSYFHPNLEVLVITNNTTPENTCNVIDLLHQANEETAQENRFKIYRCKPEDAEQLSCQRQFDVMFTDVDLGICNEMIRIVVAIRKSSTHNHKIPIIAVEQNKTHYRIGEILIYGVTKVDYTPLELPFVKDIVGNLNSSVQNHKNSTSEKTLIYTSNITSEQQTQGDLDHQPSSSTYTTLDTSSPPAFTETNTSGGVLTVEISNNVSNSSSEESQHQLHCSSTEEASLITSSVAAPQQTDQPTIVKSNTQPSNIRLVTQQNQQLQINQSQPQQTQHIFNNTINKQHVVRPTLIHQPQQRFVTTAANNTPLIPKTNMFYHTIPYYPVPNPFPTVQHQQQESSLKFNPFTTQMPPTQQQRQQSSEYSAYMVSGQGNLHNPLNVTMIADDPSKHSTKERMRRERIRRSCEQFRALLPYNNHSKKLDMATVMELTAFYIRLLQKHSTQICQKECKDIFEFYFNNSAVNHSSQVTASAAAQMAANNHIPPPPLPQQAVKRNATDADLEDIIGGASSKVSKNEKIMKSPPTISSASNQMAPCNQPIPAAAAETASQSYQQQIKSSLQQQQQQQAGDQQLMRQNIFQQQQQQHMPPILNPQPSAVFIPQNAQQHQPLRGAHQSHLRSYFDPMNRGFFTRPTALMPDFYGYGSMPPSHMYGIVPPGNSGGSKAKENNFRPTSQGCGQLHQSQQDSNFFNSTSNGHFKS